MSVFKIIKVPNEKYLFRPVKISGSITTWLTNKPVSLFDAHRIIKSLEVQNEAKR